MFFLWSFDISRISAYEYVWGFVATNRHNYRIGKVDELDVVTPRLMVVLVLRLQAAFIASFHVWTFLTRCHGAVLKKTDLVFSSVARCSFSIPGRELAKNNPLERFKIT